MNPLCPWNWVHVSGSKCIASDIPPGWSCHGILVFPPHTDAMGNTLDAKFRNSHKMWPALLTSQESLRYLRGSGPRQMRWKQAQSLDYCSLDRGRIRSDQQLPTVAHDMPQVMSRTWSNKMNLIYESYSWTWADNLYQPPHFANVKTETQSCE